jgi:23S rRNA-/tRNA-specific pseudouridylate synthase
VHLVSLGHPLAYDPLYGRIRPIRLGDLAPRLAETESGAEVVLNRLPLHARRIAFRHPSSGETVSVEAPLARDLHEFVRLLRKLRKR